MKKCPKCKKIKELSEFSKDKAQKNGLVSRCKMCKSIYRAEYNRRPEVKIHQAEYAKTPKAKASRAENAKTPKRKASQAEYAKTTKRKASMAEYNKIPEAKAYRAEYKKNNPGIVNAINAKRRAAKLQRTPKWLTKEQKIEIKEFYIVAANCSWLSEGGLNVDHIVPLQGENVSGLHVPWNLQVIPARGLNGNFSKGNKFTV